MTETEKETESKKTDSGSFSFRPVYQKGRFALPKGAQKQALNYRVGKKSFKRNFWETTCVWLVAVAVALLFEFVIEKDDVSDSRFWPLLLAFAYFGWLIPLFETVSYLRKRSRKKNTPES